MYVFVDMEWISNQHGNHWPTQLAAARVDAQWNTVDTFFRAISPERLLLAAMGAYGFFRLDQGAVPRWKKPLCWIGRFPPLAATRGYGMLVASGSK